MTIILKQLISLVNNLHDFITALFNVFGLNFTDKQLHFWVIGIIGIIIFLITNSLFKFLSKYSITAISFIYTFTVLMVIVFGIEIEQKITRRGNMEFSDIVAGVWGFIYLFLFYLLIKGAVYLVKWIMTGIKTNDTKASDTKLP